MTDKRKFNPDGPRKKPFYDTKRKMLVIPKAANGNDASGMPASGMEASGIPAAGDKALTIVRKYDHLCDIPTDAREQDKLGLHMLNEVRAGKYDDPRMVAVDLGINPYKFIHIADDNEFFRDCLDIANLFIGHQLKMRARTREEDGNVNMKLLALYDKDYRRLQEDLRQKEAARMANATTIVVERVPDSPLVPLLKKDE